MKEDNKIKENILIILRNLLAYKTTQENKEEFIKAFDYIKSLFPKELFIKEYEWNENKSLVIANTTTKNLDIVFCTHIDIVPATNYEIEETKHIIKGRGTFDMKGSLATTIELFKNLNTQKKVALFITTDEEITGACAKELLKIYNPKFAIVPDGGKNLQIVKEEKGQIQLKISIKTKSAHASQLYNGVNAITELYKLYDKLIKKYPLPVDSNDYKTSINLSMIKGGEALNSVPATASIYLDIRNTSEVTKKNIISDIRNLNNKIKIEIIHEGSFFKTDMENKYIKKYLRISEEILKKKVEIISSEATSDAIYFSDKNIPTILTNPTGDFAHAPEEYVEKESLLELYKIWKKLLEEEN